MVMTWAGGFAVPAVPLKLRATGLVENAKELTGAHSRKMPMARTFTVPIMCAREGRPIEAGLNLSVWID